MHIIREKIGVISLIGHTEQEKAHLSEVIVKHADNKNIEICIVALDNVIETRPNSLLKLESDLNKEFTLVTKHYKTLPKTRRERRKKINRNK